MKTTQELIDFMNTVFVNAGVDAWFSASDVKDWELIGDETDEKLTEYAKDFISEEHSIRCENKNSWRYEQ